MKRNKVVLIGAGSAMFTQGLVAEMIRSKRPWKIGLVAINPVALQVASGLSRRLVEIAEADIQVEASMDRKDLLPGADAVVTTIGVGGRRAWEADVFIPRKFGIYQPVGDTIMAGGISRALRLVPAMVEIAQDVVGFCPKAIFLNYANPMAVICWAVRQVTSANIVGLCIGVHEVKNRLADFIGKPRDEVTCLAAGLNHFTWLYDLRWRGEDAWHLVNEQLEKEYKKEGQKVKKPIHSGEAMADPGIYIPKIADNPFSWELFQTFGAYPSAEDRHVVEFFPERFPQGKYYGRQLGIDAFSFEGTIAHGDRIFAEMADIANGKTAINKKMLDEQTGEHSQLVDILQSIEFDLRKTFTANLPNRGAIPNLPDEAIVELTSVTTGKGFLPLAVSDFPNLLAIPINRKIPSQQITVEAALRGSRQLFVEALLEDGCISDRMLAGKLADALLIAQKDYLPQFA